MKTNEVSTNKLTELICDNYYETSIKSMLMNDPQLFSLNAKDSYQMLAKIISNQANQKQKLITISFSSFTDLCEYLIKELKLDIDIVALLTGIKNNLITSFLSGHRSCISLGAKKVSSLLILFSIPLKSFANIISNSFSYEPISGMSFSNSTKFIGPKSFIQHFGENKRNSKRSLISFIERVRNELIIKGRGDLL